MRAANALVWVVGSLVALACGGATDVTDNDDGTGGTDPGVAGSTTGGRSNNTGGASIAGAPVGFGGQQTGGRNGGVSGGTVGGSCGEAPVCKPGELGYKSLEACSSVAGCYSITVCDATIWCAPQAQCTAIPTCDPGDVQLMGTCPKQGPCYSRSLCGATILCHSPGGVAGGSSIGGTSGSAGAAGEGGAEAGGASGAGGTCDSRKGAEYNRNYVSKSARQCLLIDYGCPANTMAFMNDCGCGCEQSSSCPQVVDCMPGGPENALCKDPPLCPYTLRAL